jgi:hypothetical protein
MGHRTNYGPKKQLEGLYTLPGRANKQGEGVVIKEI